MHIHLPHSHTYPPPHTHTHQYYTGCGPVLHHPRGCCGYPRNCDAAQEHWCARSPRGDDCSVPAETYHAQGRGGGECDCVCARRARACKCVCGCVYLCVGGVNPGILRRPDGHQAAIQHCPLPLSTPRSVCLWHPVLPAPAPPFPGWMPYVSQLHHITPFLV